MSTVATPLPWALPTTGNLADDDYRRSFDAWMKAHPYTGGEVYDSRGVQDLVSGGIDSISNLNPERDAWAQKQQEAYAAQLTPAQREERTRLYAERDAKLKRNGQLAAALAFAAVGGLGAYGAGMFGGAGAGAGAGAAGGGGAATGAGTSWNSLMSNPLFKMAMSKGGGELMKAVSGGGNGGGAGMTGNAITDWLTSLGTNGVNALSGINPLQSLFANYQMQGSERDVKNSESKANEYADYLMSQIGRTTGTADQLSKALKEALGPNANSATQEQLLRAILGGNNGQAGIDALKALGDKREAWMAEDRAKLDGVMTGAGDRLDALLKKLGDARIYGESDVTDLAGDIYNKKSGAVDRAVKLASSQGFADSLTRGLGDSTQAGDSRDAVARRFADVYSGLEADSRSQAVDQVGRMSDLQSRQRASSIDELTKVLSPELNARVATYRPDSTAQAAAQAEAEFGQRDLTRLAALRQALSGEDITRTGALIGGLNTANRDATLAAGGLAESASKAYSEALKSLGANRSRMFDAVGPAAGSFLSGVVKDSLPALIQSLPSGMSGVASILTKFLNSGQEEMTPEVQAAIEQAYAGWHDQQQPIMPEDLANWNEWALPDDWFAGWSDGLGDLFGG